MTRVFGGMNRTERIRVSNAINELFAASPEIKGLVSEFYSEQQNVADNAVLVLDTDSDVTQGDSAHIVANSRERATEIAVELMHVLVESLRR